MAFDGFNSCSGNLAYYNATAVTCSHEIIVLFDLKILGMSFGVRFKVRTFGNKHPDGSNVRIFFSDIHLCMYILISIYIHKWMFVECSLESTFIIKSY